MTGEYALQFFLDNGDFRLFLPHDVKVYVHSLAHSHGTFTEPELYGLSLMFRTIQRRLAIVILYCIVVFYVV